jgi:hypothetical protein
MNNSDKQPINPADQAAKNLQERTDAKLRFAKVHLSELQALESVRGDDFERAHQESFLYQLLGARDAFLAEINYYYDAGAPDGASMGDIYRALKKRNVGSSELAKLYGLEKDDGSWFSKAKRMRDHSTHKSNVPRTFYAGGDEDGRVKLHDPKTGALSDHHYVDEFDCWLDAMVRLVAELRESALKKRASCLK